MQAVAVHKRVTESVGILFSADPQVRLFTVMVYLLFIVFCLFSINNKGLHASKCYFILIDLIR